MIAKETELSLHLDPTWCHGTARHLRGRLPGLQEGLHLAWRGRSFAFLLAWDCTHWRIFGPHLGIRSIRSSQTSGHPNRTLNTKGVAKQPLLAKSGAIPRRRAARVPPYPCHAKGALPFPALSKAKLMNALKHRRTVATKT